MGTFHLFMKMLNIVRNLSHFHLYYKIFYYKVGNEWMSVDCCQL